MHPHGSPLSTTLLLVSSTLLGALFASIMERFVDLESGSSVTTRNLSTKSSILDRIWNASSTYGSKILLGMLVVGLLLSTFAYVCAKTTPHPNIFQDTIAHAHARVLHEENPQVAATIEAVCESTIYRDMCLSTLQGTKDLSWPSYVGTTVRASLSAIEDALRGWTTSLDALPTSNGIHYQVMAQCIMAYTNAAQNVKDSLDIIGDSLLKPSPKRLEDVNVDIGMALTHHDVCLDNIKDWGLEGTDIAPFASSFTGESILELLNNAFSLTMG